jgi:hypothetical protein
MNPTFTAKLIEVKIGTRLRLDDLGCFLSEEVTHKLVVYEFRPNGDFFSGYNFICTDAGTAVKLMEEAAEIARQNSATRAAAEAHARAVTAYAPWQASPGKPPDEADTRIIPKP